MTEHNDFLVVGRLLEPHNAAVLHMCSLEAMKLNIYLRGLRTTFEEKHQDLRIVLIADGHFNASRTQLRILKRAIGLAGFGLVAVMGEERAAWAEYLEVETIEGKPHLNLNVEASKMRREFLEQVKVNTVVNENALNSNETNSPVEAPVSETLVVEAETAVETLDMPLETVDVIVDDSNKNEDILETVLNVMNAQTDDTGVVNDHNADTHDNITDEVAPVAAFNDDDASTANTDDVPALETPESETGEDKMQQLMSMVQRCLDWQRATEEQNTPLNVVAATHIAEHTGAEHTEPKTNTPVLHSPIEVVNETADADRYNAPLHDKVENNDTLRLKQRVRGGQVVVHGGDIIVEGPIHPGGEVRAVGDVHVYGVGGGRILAGMTGDQRACIYIQSFDAEIVSIAGIYKVFEEVPPGWLGRPIKIELREGKLKFYPMNEAVAA